MPFTIAELKSWAQDGLQIFLICMFIFGLIDIIWTLFRRVSEGDHFSLPHTISAILTYLLMIIVAVYFAFFYDNPFFDTF